MNYFEDIELFSDLSVEDQNSLSDFCQTQTLQTGDILFHQGDEPQAMYVISSGTLLVRKQSDTGESRDVATLGEGELVGEIAFFGEPPTRNATIVAQEESSIIVIIKFGIEQMMNKYPDLYNKVKKIIEDRT